MKSPVFTEWQGQSLPDMLGACRDLLEDTDFPTVNRWRDQGGKVIGHFQVYFPEEVAHAAGALPLKIRGATVEANRADSHFGSYLCSILKTSLEIALSERVKLDMFVSHPICDAARNLAAIWGRNFPYPCQILYLPQNPNSAHSAIYLRDEYDRLRSSVESVTGTTITDDALRYSIGIFNENRRLLRELYAIRREMPWAVTGDESYALMAMGCLIPREEHNDLLRAVLPQLRTRSMRREDRIRVVFEGGFCEQPPIDLIRVLSQSCYIVDDDLLIGLRWILQDVPTDGDPLANLASAYIDCSSYSPVQHDLRKPKEKMLLERVAGSHADAVIVCAAKMCEPGLEEQVAYTQALDKAKIPYFLGEFEENMTSFEHLELQVATFLENVMFA